MAARLTFAGSGDAFGTGGRFNACFHVTAGQGAFLIDCGASALISLRRLGLDPGTLGAVFISHLHGDHFGGLPNFLLDARLISRRTAPLTIAGPPGLRDRLDALMEVLYPGMGARELPFALDIVELPVGDRTQIAGMAVETFEVVHFSGAPSLALRFEANGSTIAYSGDTEWTDALLPAARDADLFICECYMYDRDAKGHLSYARIMDRLDALAAKRVVLTHMGPDMMANLDKADTARVTLAEDGLSLDI